MFSGTVAFGSLIIAILRMVRVMLEKVEEKLAKYHQDNKLVKAAMCVCKCCFWCLEKFMKFLNRNAYIMCAVSGNNFCTSAKASVTYYLVVHLSRCRTPSSCCCVTARGWPCSRAW